MTALLSWMIDASKGEITPNTESEIPTRLTSTAKSISSLITFIVARPIRTPARQEISISSWYAHVVGYYPLFFRFEKNNEEKLFFSPL